MGKARSSRITISDVAREAGVAQSTVSLVLNRRGRVSDATRERVRQVMHELGYVPRPNVARPNRHVAVVYSREMVFCSELVHYCREWIGGIRETLGENGATDISLFCGQEHVSKDPMFEAMLSEGGLDGVLLMGVFPYDGYLDRVQASGLPVVVFNQVPTATEFSSVSVDYGGAVVQVIEHLAELGHRRICCIFNRRSPVWQLVNGQINDAIRAHDMERVEIPIPSPNRGFEDLPLFEDLARQVRDTEITAVFSGDPLAYRLGHALESIGVPVPERVSLVGFDNFGFRIQNRKRLSSVDYDTVEMGRLAGRVLGDLWQRKEDICNVVIRVPSKFFWGETTGPPPQSVQSAPAGQSGQARRRRPVLLHLAE